MLADLAARGDDLSARVATALKTLVDDLAKAHADAASSAVNNEQRFHQLEHETVAARSETERMTKLKEDAERRGEQSEARVTALTNEVPAGVRCRSLLTQEPLQACFPLSCPLHRVWVTPESPLRAAAGRAAVGAQC